MFSRNLKKYRKKRRYTQHELANLLFVSRTTVSAWENGVTEPDLSALIALKSILNITYEQLLEENED